jgi:hypothetical protein
MTLSLFLLAKAQKLVYGFLSMNKNQQMKHAAKCSTTSKNMHISLSAR